MKCPYRKSVIHKPPYIAGNTQYCAEDIENFEECYRDECPYYIAVGVCGKAQNEMIRPLEVDG